MGSLFSRKITFRRDVPTPPSRRTFEFVLPAGGRAVITATSAQEALILLRAEYGVRCFREAFLVS